jgi:oligoendopeptidase F
LQGNDAPAIQAEYQKLVDQQINNAQELEQWILHWSEAESIVREQEARLYINMTCFTDDKDNAEAYTRYVEEVEPVLAPLQNQLEKKLLASPYLSDLADYYQNWLRDVKSSNELFREENIAIETEISLEVQRYQQLTGSLSVQYEGEEKTLPQMRGYLEEKDRSVREASWKLVAQRRLQEKDKLDEHFDKLFAKRLEVARNAGYENYLDYIFKAKGRYDYTPDDCRTFHQSVEELVVPLARQLQEKRRQSMNLETLRPWDLACDPEGRDPLRPFKDSRELIDKTVEVFSKVSPELQKEFIRMRDDKLLDLDSRLGKAPGGYQCGLEEYRVPFIFMNASGTNSDVFTLLHESGHSFHQFAMARHDLQAYRDIPAEFAEVASMAMEMIAMDKLGVFYDEGEQERAVFDHLESVFSLLMWVATVDAFQIWLYSHPEHTRAERQAEWVSLCNRFSSGTDWSGLEEELAYSWHRQLHIFEVPFYYIEYGIAQLGALQVWKNYRENPEQALQLYRDGLALGNSRPLPELFSTAGIRFDFGAHTIKPLMDMIQQEL